MSLDILQQVVAGELFSPAHEGKLGHDFGKLETGKVLVRGQAFVENEKTAVVLPGKRLLREMTGAHKTGNLLAVQMLKAQIGGQLMIYGKDRFFGAELLDSAADLL